MHQNHYFPQSCALSQSSGTNAKNWKKKTLSLLRNSEEMIASLWILRYECGLETLVSGCRWMWKDWERIWSMSAAVGIVWLKHFIFLFYPSATFKLTVKMRLVCWIWFRIREWSPTVTVTVVLHTSRTASASYLTIRTSVIFDSLIGLKDKLI